MAERRRAAEQSAAEPNLTAPEPTRDSLRRAVAVAAGAGAATGEARHKRATTQSLATWRRRAGGEVKLDCRAMVGLW